MAAPDNFRVARLTLVYQRDSRTFNNTIHLYRAAGWVLSDLIQAAQNAHTWYTAFVKPILMTQIALNNIHVQVYDPNGNPYVYDLPISPPEAGTAAGEPEPGNVTVSLSLRAGLAGRAYRGRIYFPGLLTVQTNNDDTLPSATQTALGTALTGLLTAFVTGTVPVIFHRNDNLFSTIVSWVVENIIDSQRRRLPKRGQ